MSTPPDEYYTAERWQNWLERVEEEDLDPEDEDAGRLLLNLQDDTAIAVAKVIAGHTDGELGQERAMEELANIREIVLPEVEMDDEDAAMLVESVQTALVPVFYAAEEYVAEGPAEDGSVADYISAAVDAEAEEDLDSAVGFCAQAGTLVIDGDSLDREVVEDLEFGYVAEWVNGLDSLQTAMRDPEVVEEEE
ncbi:DUF2150 domain-containing protein [Haloglomus irregulare]|jgi:hypothetical protein|uniref:DUF2150 domain-containing protein n=1 Tax=Haloglomus irregulare TaxID=2234134 RepID=A0A554NCT9_9EURY|nr:DUF2150 family protein [Haloglomus irregulare]TSD15207.1 DUF2150 domain-containing protein [Haloglomus irregulare]